MRPQTLSVHLASGSMVYSDTIYAQSAAELIKRVASVIRFTASRLGVSPLSLDYELGDL
jgi:hypothetical protein